MPILKSYGNLGVEMPKKRNRSDSYQYKIVEIAVDPNVLSDFPHVDSLGSQLNLAKYSEEFYLLKKELMTEVLRIINTCLTERQREVVLLRLKGKTQTQIAEELGIHQTTVHKILSGNLDYRYCNNINKLGNNGKKKGGSNNRSEPKRYGGVERKLKKLCFKDEKIIEILDKMEYLRTSAPYIEDFTYELNIFGDDNNDDE